MDNDPLTGSLPVFPVGGHVPTENDASNRLAASGEAIGAVIDALASGIADRLTGANGQISTVQRRLKQQARQRMKTADELVLPSVESVAVAAAEKMAAANMMLAQAQTDLTSKVQLPGIPQGQIVPTYPTTQPFSQPPPVTWPVFPPCCTPLWLWRHRRQEPKGTDGGIDRLAFTCPGNGPPGLKCVTSDTFNESNCWDGPEVCDATRVAWIVQNDQGMLGAGAGLGTMYLVWLKAYCTAISPTPPFPPPPVPPPPLPPPIPPPPPVQPPLPPLPPPAPSSTKACATCAECKDGTISKVDQRVAMIPWGINVGGSASFGSDCGQREIIEAMSAVLPVGPIVDAINSADPRSAVDALFVRDVSVQDDWWEIESAPVGVPTIP